MEQGLCSPGGEFTALSRKFIAVRLYYTAKGASEPFTRLGLGNPAAPRNNVDLAFIAPDGRNIDVRTLTPAGTSSRDGIWVRDVVASAKNQAGDGKEILQKTIEIMKELPRLYPGKVDALGVPWQVSLSHAVFVSAWDSKLARESGHRFRRRIVLVPAPGGQADPALEKALSDPDVLRKCERYYVFAKVDPAEAPSEMADAFTRAGSGGVVLLDAAGQVNGFGEGQQAAARIYPKVLEAKPGPHTKSSILSVLSKHVAPPEPSSKAGAR